LAALKKMLVQRHTTVLPITEAITQRATDLLEILALSHGLQMGDCLIAGTALEHQFTVLTSNLKHFRAVPGLLVEAFEPRA